jgi:2-phospho-L-lactate guanylyltransferase (CobY/MobA/RfbA family)
MARDFPESDWKVFREVRAAALARFCDRVLTDIHRISADLNKSAHDRYVEIYRLIEERDRQLARAFDAPRRSQAISQLALISSLGLLTPEELSRFTSATRDSIIAVAEIFQQPRRRGRGR